MLMNYPISLNDLFFQTDMTEEEINKFNLKTGRPFFYEFDQNLKIVTPRTEIYND